MNCAATHRTILIILFGLYQLKAALSDKRCFKKCRSNLKPQKSTSKFYVSLLRGASPDQVTHTSSNQETSPKQEASTNGPIVPDFLLIGFQDQRDERWTRTYKKFEIWMSYRSFCSCCSSLSEAIEKLCWKYCIFQKKSNSCKSNYGNA